LSGSRGKEFLNKINGLRDLLKLFTKWGALSKSLIFRKSFDDSVESRANLAVPKTEPSVGETDGVVAIEASGFTFNAIRA